MTNQPSKAHVIRALSRMARSALETGHYSFDRIDAKWVNAAIEMLCDMD